MPAFGFSVEYENGITDFVIATGRDIGDAKENLQEALHGMPIVAIVDYYIDGMVADQYNGVAFLSPDSGLM